jgi:isoleucyl-tRNA synthetase
MSMSDANWGPQDASISSLVQELPLFVSRSMSAYYIDLLGPLHWMSKRQKVTAASSAEAVIYATDECVKFLLELNQILEFLGVKDIFMPSTTTVFNDYKACVQWSKAATSKGLRHIQMRENRVRENIVSKFVQVCHINGKINLADIFTKEMKDTSHFVEIRDLFMCHRLSI